MSLGPLAPGERRPPSVLTVPFLLWGLTARSRRSPRAAVRKRRSCTAAYATELTAPQPWGLPPAVAVPSRLSSWPPPCLSSTLLFLELTVVGAYR